MTPGVVAQDWRGADDSVVASLYAGEVDRWRDRLSWDTSTMWPIVESGRRAGTVAGAIARDAAGATEGWCFALLQDGTLQVGGFVSRSAEATAVMIEALLGSPDGQAARRCLWFGYFDAPGLADALTSRGASVARYVYLRCALRRDGALPAEPAPAAVNTIRGWRASDAPRVPALLSSAYRGEDSSRPFAPSGRLEEWHEYVALLVGSAGCGVFDPSLSLVADTGSDRLDAAAIVTRITPATAHLAQLAVRAEAQEGGVGQALLSGAKALARAGGCTQLTLLVHEQNARARRLYARAGFDETAVFLSAAWERGTTGGRTQN